MFLQGSVNGGCHLLAGTRGRYFRMYVLQNIFPNGFCVGPGQVLPSRSAQLCKNAKTLRNLRILEILKNLSSPTLAQTGFWKSGQDSRGGPPGARGSLTHHFGSIRVLCAHALGLWRDGQISKSSSGRVEVTTDFLGLARNQLKPTLSSIYAAMRCVGAEPGPAHRKNR